MEPVPRNECCMEFCGRTFTRKEVINTAKETLGLKPEEYVEEKAKELHEEASDYPAPVEEMFNGLLVLTACFASFAHGGNDVANAVAPVAAVAALYEFASTVKMSKYNGGFC